MHIKLMYLFTRCITFTWSGQSVNGVNVWALLTPTNSAVTCSSKALIENAVESCLRLPKLSLELQNKALLLRAKARLAASLHTSANQGRDLPRPRPRVILDDMFADRYSSLTQTWKRYLELILTILKQKLSWVAR